MGCMACLVGKTTAFYMVYYFLQDIWGGASMAFSSFDIIDIPLIWYQKMDTEKKMQDS